MPLDEPIVASLEIEQPAVFTETPSLEVSSLVPLRDSKGLSVEGESSSPFHFPLTRCGLCFRLFMINGGMRR